MFNSGVDIPEINEEQCKIYNKALICWDHPQKPGSSDTYILEYRKLNREDTNPAWQEIEVFSKNKIISDLDTNSSYSFRVRGYKGSICSPWSREVIFHTPPAPGTVRDFSNVDLSLGGWRATHIKCVCVIKSL